MYKGIYSELPSEEEVEIMSDNNCREYSDEFLTKENHLVFVWFISVSKDFSLGKLL